MKPKDLSNLTIIIIPTGFILGVTFFKSNKLISVLCFAFSVVAIAAKLMMSDNFQKWLNRDKIEESTKNGKRLLSNHRYSEAALAFTRALTFEKYPGLHLGLAYSIEKLGDVDAALLEYHNAYFQSYNYEKKVLANMADFYVRALMRMGTDDDINLALKSCDDSLYHLSELSDPVVDYIRMSRGIILLKLRRDDEARDQFNQLAESAVEPDIRRKARDMAFRSSLVDFARDGLESFFDNIDIIEDALRYKN